jgi:L-cysteine S-thiosulfotransferase
MKCLLSFAFVALSACTSVTQPPQQTSLAGKQIAFSRDKGNCLACHVIEDGEFPGNIGPELKALSSRFKSKQELREQIWDATRNNPETSMPPFGKNKILMENEIDQVVDYLWGIK